MGFHEKKKEPITSKNTMKVKKRRLQTRQINNKSRCANKLTPMTVNMLDIGLKELGDESPLNKTIS